MKSKPISVSFTVTKCFFISIIVFSASFANARGFGPLSRDNFMVKDLKGANLYLVDTLPAPGHFTNIVTPNKKRVVIITAVNVSLWTISFIALNKSWYAAYPRSSFHFFNDNNEWNQMDKAGHFWTNYHITRLSSEMWRWTGLPDKKSLILGGISGVAYQSIIEIQDGFSKEWGFSWGDMATNVLGAAAFVSQELGWKEQRIQVKLSYWPYNYPDDLTTRRNQLFGKSAHERILKDYNSQIYWASANIASFIPKSPIPKWLNISVGYGSDGMFGGTQNTWVDKSGNSFDRTDIRRMRRFYLSPDIDLTKIKTRSSVLKTVFYVVNLIKVPAPALEINSAGKLQFHYLKF